MARYLEAAYYISHEGEAVRGSRLADWLGVSAPTVSVGVQRLREDGLISFGPDHLIRLTEAGEAAAAEVVRRHRVVERWLTDVLGLDWATADQEAGRMSHFFSDLVLDRIYAQLGRPATCPHGNDIPGAQAPERQLVNLCQAEPGRQAVISRISEVAEREAPQLLRLLDQEGLRPGVVVEVHPAPAADAVWLAVDDRRIALGMGAARAVWVEVSPGRGSA